MATEPLQLYLREVESHKLLTPVEEKAVLKALVGARETWTRSYLHSEGGLEAFWKDLQTWKTGDMAASAIVPGPPRLKEGQIGPVHYVPRLYDIFEKHVARAGDRPFHYRIRRQTSWLVRAILFVGIRPKPLDRYRMAAEARHGANLKKRVEDARQRFVEIRGPLIERNLRLVLKVAWGFIPGPMSFDELIQEGNIGLIRATESFNGRFKVRFSTYAYLWIRQAVIRALEEKSRMIRLPVHLTHLLRKVAKDKRDGIEPPATMEHQGKRYRLPKLLANPSVTGSMVSLDQSRSDDGGLADSIPDRAAPSPEAGADLNDLSDYVQSSLDFLGDRHRRVLQLRFGIGHARPHTLSEIGGVLGVSSERIRQIQEEALSALRDCDRGVILAELARG
ncbi:MAG: sigma-70 family RNA polymerase sigma factor [Planctomycetota bacterium]